MHGVERVRSFIITHFMALGSFYFSRNHQKISGFLMFSGITERGQCYKFSFSDMQITIRSAIDHSKSEKLCSSPLFVTDGKEQEF